MQKTETYKLNLIELDDTFSPQPLNENAQKLEDALSGAVGGLDQRLAAIEAHKLAAGFYEGNSPSTNDTVTQTVPLGFDPVLVYIQCSRSHSVESALILPGTPYRDNFTETAELVPGGFAVSRTFNRQGETYTYFALL